MNENLNVEEALSSVRGIIALAGQRFDEFMYVTSEYDDAAWFIESCYLQMLALTEAIGLEEMHKMLFTEYNDIKKSKEGFDKAINGPDEPYSIHLSRLRQYLFATEQFFPNENQTSITKDIEQILRDIHYTITDKKLFGFPPRDEDDVQLRIEGILRSIFPDLKHKPALTKPIKNFIPDTGIPSIQTLIEYKFLGRKSDAPIIAEQILADTRGYTSRDWNHFIYVVYETSRFKPEKEWRQLLLQTGISNNTTLVVLSGEPVTRRKRRQKGSKGGFRE